MEDRRGTNGEEEETREQMGANDDGGGDEVGEAASVC